MTDELTQDAATPPAGATPPAAAATPPAADTPIPVPTRMRLLAALANVVLPPLGHVLLGRALRGVVLWLAIVIAGALVAGLVIAVPGIATLVLGSILALAMILALPVDAFVRAGAPRPRRYRRAFVYLLVAVASMVAGQVVTGVLRNTVLRAYRLPSGSMQGTLRIGDRFFSDRVFAGGWTPARGDIIVYTTDFAGREFVKRVIGLPGETIELRRKRVFVDGQPLAEPYVQHVDPNVVPDRDDFAPHKIPSGTLFVLGDNRDDSNVSRFMGPVPIARVKGRARVLYWSSDSTGRVRWERIGRRL